MRAALILYTEFPNGPAFNNVGCDTQFFPVNLKGMSPAFLDERRKYAKVGIGRNIHNDEWPDSPTDPVLFAERFSQDFTDLASPSFYAKGVAPKQCYGLYNGESHDMDFHLAMFKRFRQLRTSRLVLWAIEPGQGGLFVAHPIKDFVNADANILVVVEAYRGDMQPFDASVARKNLEDAGLRADRITVFHGLRDQHGTKRVVSDWWDGVLYVENKSQNDSVGY